MRISTATLALASPLITMASSPAAERDLSPEQSPQRCIDAAASADALKMCRREMKQARKSLKQDYRAHMNKVRNQLGLPARTGNKRDA